MSTVKEKTAEGIIEFLFGIKPGSNDLTPMDYGECKKALDYVNATASLRAERLQEENERLKTYMLERAHLVELNGRYYPFDYIEEAVKFASLWNANIFPIINA